MVLSGKSTCRWEGVAVKARIELAGQSKLTLQGQGGEVLARLAGQSRLQSYEMPINDFWIESHGQSEAQVTVTHRLRAGAYGSSIIYYQGHPDKKEVQVTGRGKILGR